LIPSGKHLDEPLVEYELRRRAMRHPGAAAALVAGVINVPRRLSLIVSQHHERLDGTGYPAGTSGHLLCPLSRWVLTTTRFQEILTARLRRAGLTADEALQQTAAVFWREAAGGRLDRQVAEQLLETLQSGLTVRVSAAVAESPTAQVDGQHPLPAPHGGRPAVARPTGLADQSIREPKFLRKSRNGADFYVPPAPALRKRMEQAERARFEQAAATASPGGLSR